MKISVDFDGTLEFQDVQTYIKELIEQGIEVHITTSRYKDPSSYLPVIVNHDDLYEISNKLGITTINFTDFCDKYLFLKNKDYLFHLDDDRFEVFAINTKTNVKGIDALQYDWKDKCEKLINNTISNKDPFNLK